MDKLDKGVQVDLIQTRCDMQPPATMYEEVKKIADFLLEKTRHRPTVGIICGSGLGGLADDVTDREIFPYKDIPGFPLSTAPSHQGKLIFGQLSGKTVVCMQGRLHPYEGYPLWKCALPVRVMHMMGVRTLIVTNACGALNPDYVIGDVMIIRDHINIPGLAGLHPLRGPNDDRFGLRFPAMNRAYDLQLRRIARKVAERLEMTPFLREGCYVMQSGPTFETVGEARAMKALGGDVAGMSTVHEVIAAAHSGMRVFGLSLVTNYITTTDDDDMVVLCEHVLEIGRERAHVLQNFLCQFLSEVSDEL